MVRKPDFSRRNHGLLAVPEQRAIAWLAPRLPSWFTPNRLTALGLASAIIAFFGYVLVGYGHPAGLWIVNLCLLLNWFGDSFDGEIARRRGIDRPRFGLFLDQSVDVIAQFTFAMGFGVSGYVRMDVAAIALSAYLALTVQSLLRVEVDGIFHLATGKMGLTENRAIFFVANIVFYFWPPTPFLLHGVQMTYADLLGMAWIGVNLTIYLMAMIAQLKSLALEEPPRSDDR
jgi:phosphatidylglycerophosphate synthase